MRIHTLALAMACTFPLSAGCLDEDPAAHDLEDESSVTQEVFRGWFSLHRVGQGIAWNSNVAGLSMELHVGTRQDGRTYAYPYVQRNGGSPPVSLITGYVWANCSNGLQPYFTWSQYLTDFTSLPDASTPTCPPFSPVVDAWFYLGVDN